MAELSIDLCFGVRSSVIQARFVKHGSRGIREGILPSKGNNRLKEGHNRLASLGLWCISTPEHASQKRIECKIEQKLGEGVQHFY